MNDKQPFRSPAPRLSRRQRLILALPAAGGEMAGLELVAASRGPAYRRLGRGMVYVALRRRNFSLVLEPVIRDLRQEYVAALAKRRRWKARWVRLRGTWAFWSAVAGLLPLSILSFLFRRWK